MKKSSFVNYICNGIILIAIVSVALFGFSGGTILTFGRSNDIPIYKGNTDRSRVSIMFNVYQGNEYVEQILTVLELYNVKATFFIGGSWAEKNIETLKLIHYRGHEIGNHGFFHKDHSRLTKDENYVEIYTTHMLVLNSIGVKMTLFAPPSGAFNDTALSVSTSLGYTTVMWSKDTIDWRDQDVSLIYERATKNVCGGDLILAHPTACTAKALPDILSYYVSNGFEVVTVSQNLYGG